MWKTGHITPVWNENYKNFNYIKKPLNLKEETVWKDSNYNSMLFGGSLYDNSNTMPDWIGSLGEKIGLTNCGYSFYKMITGEIIPKHVDHYNLYCKLFNVPREQVKRAIIFLEDWKSGHYFEMDSYPIMDYKAGDYVYWSYNVPHLAANIGVEDRYTLQITGIENE